MISKEVYLSLCNNAKAFVREYHDDTLEQSKIDTTIVEFINRFALMQSSLKLNFSIEALYDEKQTENSVSMANLDKTVLKSELEYWKEDLCHDEDSLRVISAFIQYCLSD